jgi:hypothetical protein
MMDKGNDPPPNLREVFLDVNLFFWERLKDYRFKAKNN